MVFSHFFRSYHSCALYIAIPPTDDDDRDENRTCARRNNDLEDKHVDGDHQSLPDGVFAALLRTLGESFIRDI